MRKVTICFYSNGLKLKVSINSNQENTKSFNLRRERATGKQNYILFIGDLFFYGMYSYLALLPLYAVLSFNVAIFMKKKLRNSAKLRCACRNHTFYLITQQQLNWFMFANRLQKSRRIFVYLNWAF